MLIGVSGCQAPNASSTALMPTPALFWNGDIDPFALVPEDKRKTSVEVFYASDHEPSGATGIDRYLKGKRSQVLRIGAATVRFGDDGMSWRRLGELSRMERRPQQISRRLTALEEYGALGITVPPAGLIVDPEEEGAATRDATARFAESINDRLASSHQKSINVYVHGFNATTADSITTIGQLHYYLGMEGVAIGYTWPSQKQLIGGYHADKANARFTVRHFRLLLEFLATRTDVDHINILAHSAGAPIVVDTLRQIRFLHDGRSPAEIQRRTKIGAVMLGAPDGDLDWFVNACLDGWMQTARIVNVYASQADRALKISSKIYEAPRTGAAVGHLGRAQLEALRKYGNLWAINVTPAKRYNKLISGHYYHYMNSWVSSDVLLAMKFGVSPEKRGLVPAPDGVFWTFPEDYTEHLRPVAAALYETVEKH